MKKRIGESIPGFENYTITFDGTIYNRKRQPIKNYIYRGKEYARLYKNGIRYTVSIDKLVYELSNKDKINRIDIDAGELLFRYEDTPYLISNYGRVFNTKFQRWVNVIYRNGSPTVNISHNGRVEVVSIIKFLKSQGGHLDAS